MKKHIIKTLTALAITTSAFNTSSPKFTAKAESNNQEVINSLYEQLVIEGKNEATFTGTDYEEHDEIVSYVEDIVTELYAIDKKETPFDGTAIAGRGNLIYKKKGTQYTITYRSAYDIGEAQKVIQEIIDNELSDKIDENSTKREIMYEICDYITSNYSYDKEITKLAKDKKPSFVDAYYGDHKMICTGFSNLAYLLATELGIDCIIICTDSHQFIAAQTSDNGEYTAYDLTKGKYASLTWIEKTATDLTNGTYKISEHYVKKINTINSYSLANSTEQYRQLWYYISNGQATALDYYTDLCNAEIGCHLLAVIAIIIGFNAFKGKKHKKNHRKDTKRTRRVTV